MMARMDSVPAASAGTGGQGESWLTAIISAATPSTMTAATPLRILYLSFTFGSHHETGADYESADVRPYTHAMADGKAEPGDVRDGRAAVGGRVFGVGRTGEPRSL